jgi:hypothetical protein
MVVPLVGEAESPNDEDMKEDGDGIVTGGIEGQCLISFPV